MDTRTDPRKAAHVPRAPHRTLTGLGAALLGVLATGVGAGLSIRHLQKDGLSVVSVVGLALLAAGVVLLAAALVGFWRRVRGWRRLCLVPAALLALAVLYSITIAVMLTVVPPTALP